MSDKPQWKKGEPEFEGLYLTAVRYPNGLGELDLLHWRGAWYTLYDLELIPDNYRIIGYLSTTDIVRSFKGNWPDWDNED